MERTQKANLLIVDDEADLRELLAEQVGSDDYDITLAENGKAALEIILARRPSESPIDVVLSDINMPKLNGLDLLEQVRKSGIDVPFIFLTAYGDKEKAVKALRLGALDFLEKPYNTNELIRSVANALKRGRISSS